MEKVFMDPIKCKDLRTAFPIGAAIFNNCLKAYLITHEAQPLSGRRIEVGVYARRVLI
jgi:hypothetical protein